jgi:uncharacterized protein (DUF111 family)
VELLRDAPTYGTTIPMELTTPTGAALLSALGSGYGPMPAMVVRATGFGAGSRDLDGIPNAVQVVIGDNTDRPGSDQPGQPVILLEANVDDVTGETLAHTVAALLDAGAFDAWIAPIVAKKGRPAYIVSALADPLLAGQLRGVLVAETGTLGVRYQSLNRWASPRTMDEVEVEGYPVRIKVSPGRIKPEHDDAARVARLVGLPLREVTRRAEQEAHRRLRAMPSPSPTEPPDSPGQVS